MTDIIVQEVLKHYGSYLQSPKKKVEAWILEEFLREQEDICLFLHLQEDATAVKRTVSLYEYLDEHDAVHPRIHYPGPTPAFKALCRTFM